MLSVLLHPAAYPLLLPHFGHHHGAVHVGGERRGDVTAGEGRFLDAGDGAKTLGEIAAYADVTPAFVASVAHWFAWWPEPIAPPALPGCAAERLVLTATPEGAWLGMGASLIADAAAVTTTMISCFQVGPQTLGAGSRTVQAQVWMACADEAAFAARLAGVGFDQLEIPAAAGRRRMGVSPDLITGILCARIAQAVETLGAHELFVPAGLGRNEDARLLFDAVVGLVGEGRLTCQVTVYEDEPAIRGERHIDELYGRFESSFLVLEERARPVDGVMARKAGLLQVFRHRLGRARRRDWTMSARRNAARLGQGDAAACERFWDVRFAQWT